MTWKEDFKSLYRDFHLLLEVLHEEELIRFAYRLRKAGLSTHHLDAELARREQAQKSDRLKNQ